MLTVFPAYGEGLSEHNHSTKPLSSSPKRSRAAAAASGGKNQDETYDKVFPEFMNRSGKITVTADCSISLSSFTDCFVGVPTGGGNQNFTLEGKNPAGISQLTIEGKLPSQTSGSSSKDIILNLNKLRVEENARLTFSGFYATSVSTINVTKNSSLSVALSSKKGTNPSYGNTAAFTVVDKQDGDDAEGISISGGSSLTVTGGNMLVGATEINVEKDSAIRVGASGSSSSDEITSQAHITNMGLIKAKKIKNGGEIKGPMSGSQMPIPGISLGSKPGVIDNYGTIDGEFVNESGSTLNLFTLDGKMGKINGKYSGSGKVNIHPSGATYGDHTIAGTGSSNLTANIMYDNGSNDFIEAKVDTNNQKLTITKKDENINKFRSGLGGGQRDLLDALDSMYNIYTYGGRSFLKEVANDSQDGLSSAYLMAPYAMLDTLKARFNPFNSNFDINLIGAGYAGNGIGLGGLGGINIYYKFNTKNNTFQVSIGYGYGVLSNSLNKYKTSLSGNIISVGLIDRLSMDNLELDLGFHSLNGIFSSNQTIDLGTKNISEPSGSTEFSIYNIDLDANVGYRINFGEYSLKPYAGANQTLSIRDKTVQKGGLGAYIPSIGIYNLYIIGGLENRYVFSNKNALTLNLNYQYMLLSSSEKINIQIKDTKVRIDAPYRHKLSLDLGGEFPIGENSGISIDAFYNTALINNVHSFGGKLTYSHKF